MATVQSHLRAALLFTLACVIRSSQLVELSYEDDPHLVPPPSDTLAAELAYDTIRQENYLGEVMPPSSLVPNRRHPATLAENSLVRGHDAGAGQTVMGSSAADALHSYGQSVEMDWFRRQGERLKLHPNSNGSATKNIWIQSLPRQGSSALMSFLSIAAEAADVFGIYEPCFPTDSYRGQPQNARVCPDVLAALQRCQFDDIQNLHSWNYSCRNARNHQWNACDGHNHMSLHYHDEYERAPEDCANAKVRIWKTTTMPINMLETIQKGADDLRVVNLVRDPRATLASAVKLWGLGSRAGRWAKNMLNAPSVVCRELNHRNMDHAQVHHVRFEDMVHQPLEFFEQVYGFLDLPLTTRAKAFISGHFGNSRCVEVLNNNCRKRPEGHVDAWRHMPELVNITSKMQSSPECVQLFNTFGYKF